MRRLAAIAFIAAMIAGPLTVQARGADACAGLIGSNGAVNLGRTTTLAGYHDGVEHYVTAFEFLGGGGEFGTLIPLPAVPSKVERGGDWTLQRLQQETAPVFSASGGVGDAEDAAYQARAEVILEVKIDALDITVLEGGGPSVATWAQEHGFRLSPDAPEVLDFYAQRSPIFLAAIFDGDAALERGQQVGDGTPVHITMPTDDPWVPLRILGLGKQDQDFIEADVFLLTDERPALLPEPNEGMARTYDQKANDLLLSDLRSDAGMEWVPDEAWLTKLSINTSAQNLKYDLAVSVDGDAPSRVAAGLDVIPDLTGNITIDTGGGTSDAWIWALGIAFLAAVFVGTRYRRAPQ